MKKTEKTKKFLKELGYFYFEKNNKDPDKTFKELNQLGIREISVKTKLFGYIVVFTITLERPGLFVGKHGINLHKIESHMEHAFYDNVKILVKEAQIDDYLYSWEICTMIGYDI